MEQAMKNKASVIVLVLLVFLLACGNEMPLSVSARASFDDESADLPLSAAPSPVPSISPTFDLDFSIGEQQLSPTVSELDLSHATPEDLDRLISVLPALSSLKTVELGSAPAEEPIFSWEQIRKLTEGVPPGTAIHYSFTIAGYYRFHLDDEILNLNHIYFEDNGDLACQVADCMRNLKTLDMDSCGLSNARMEEFQKRYPGVDVIWRVKIGKDYTSRTDETRLVISNPDRGGELDTPESIEGLYYCTKIKYLDMGHNYKLSDISFVRNMPDLEVLIIAMTNIKDISPLENCPKLNYLEYQTSSACDLRPLANLKNLKDLNICFNFALHDIRPLMELDLDRLYIGCYSPIPREQIAEFKKLHPNCIVNTTTDDPTNEGWRMDTIDGVWSYVPRYAQLRLEFQYDNFPGCYAYTENDPRVWGRFEY